MRVSSPIGDLPFEPQSLRLTADGLEITGVMGAWPAQVHVSASDLPAVLRLVAKPVAAAAGVTAVLGAAAAVRSTRRHTIRRHTNRRAR